MTQILHFILKDADGTHIGRFPANGRISLVLVGIKDGEACENSYTIHERNLSATMTKPFTNARGDHEAFSPTG